MRATLDSWRTWVDVPAVHAPGGDGGSDRFMATLTFAARDGSTDIAFVVRYRVAGAEYWDNNGGANYALHINHEPDEALPPRCTRPILRGSSSDL